MPLLEARDATLVLVDFQARLMPAIQEGPRLLANAGRLAAAARLLGVRVIATEQNPAGLGPTAPELAGAADVTIAKMHFSAAAEPDFLAALGEGDLVLCGCEAHVCVAQTVLDLRGLGRRVAVVTDAVGARAAESRESALRRMARDGAEPVTAEAVIFEWLRDCRHPRFREALRLVK